MIMTKISVYYLASVAFIYGTNILSGQDIHISMLFLPLTLIAAYLFNPGLKNTKISEFPQKLINSPKELMPFRKTLEDFKKTKPIPNSKLETLENLVRDLEHNMLQPLLAQRKLYIVSLYIAPVFPLLTSFLLAIAIGYFDLLTLLVSYGATFLIGLLTRLALMNIIKTMEKLNKKLIELMEQV